MQLSGEIVKENQNMTFKVLSKQIQHYNDKDWYKVTIEDKNGEVFENVSYWYDDDIDETLYGVIEIKNGYYNFVMWSRNPQSKFVKLTDHNEDISLVK